MTLCINSATHAEQTRDKLPEIYSSICRYRPLRYETLQERDYSGGGVGTDFR